MPFYAVIYQDFDGRSRRRSWNCRDESQARTTARGRADCSTITEIRTITEEQHKKLQANIMRGRKFFPKGKSPKATKS